MYYIGGSLKPIQKLKLKDLIEDAAKFPEFPFTRKVLVKDDGKEDESSQRLVTSQKLPKMQPTEQEEDILEDEDQSSSENDEHISGEDDEVPEHPRDAPSSIAAPRRVSKRLRR